ncbi:MAG: SusD/RagB family nutrient-binding outer membrane lipoprotein [Bacteroidota bacterium]|nr:SusD/RagB family nutrient-binding outer membrane lipoprotein [Bacteroidota bacterium]
MRNIRGGFLVCSAMAVLALGCEDYIGGTTNIDPTRPAQVDLRTMLPAIQLASANAYYSVGINTAQWTQQMSSIQPGSSDTHIPSSLGNAWSEIYLDALANADRMVKQANAQRSPYYEGTGKIMQALNLGLATDAWENVPYSQAFKGNANLFPAYDRQEQIYATIQTLLNEGIELLRRPNNNNDLPAGAQFTSRGDMIYNGNPALWIALANALRARYAIHLTAKGASTAAQNALAALNAGALTSNAQDFQFSFANARIPSPYLALANQTVLNSTFTVLLAEYYVSKMSSGSPRVPDPRLPIIAGASNGGPLPLPPAGGVSGAGSGTAGRPFITPNSWFPRNPIQMMTYAEQKFIEAEARFLAAGGTETSVGAPAEARAALIEAIRANMQKYGVATADITAYLERIPPASQIRLSTIMEEKYKALFTHPEVWVDMRRYGYSTNVYTGLTLPENHNPEANGKWIQRAIYPFSEQNRNREVFRANWGEARDFFTTVMWRDRR